MPWKERASHVPPVACPSLPRAVNPEPACLALPELGPAFASERGAVSRLGGPDAPAAPFWGRVSRALPPRRRKATWSQPWFGALPLLLRRERWCCTCVLVLNPPQVGGAFPKEGGADGNLEEPRGT